MCPGVMSREGSGKVRYEVISTPTPASMTVALNSAEADSVLSRSHGQGMTFSKEN